MYQGHEYNNNDSYFNQNYAIVCSTICLLLEPGGKII